MKATEKAKIELSGTGSTQINLPFITMRDGQPEHLDMNLTRSTFESLTANLVERTMGPTRDAIKQAGLGSDEIDKVILVGGSTRIPAVQKAIEEATGKAPFKGVNPDEAVAVGAALQAGIIVGDQGVTDVLLLDVTPLTLGIETLGCDDHHDRAEHHHPIPQERDLLDGIGQPTGCGDPCPQGERQFAKDNVTLGTFHLVGIPPAPRGMPQIEVTFDIDANGIVNQCQDLGTGTEQSIKIESQTSLSEDEIQAKIAEAERFAEEDERRKAKIDLRNTADQIVYQTRRTLEGGRGQDHGGSDG